MPLSAIDWAPKAPLQPLFLDWARRAGIELAVLRLDLIDTLISGNKWFKLAPHLRAAVDAGAEGLISLGGAHSNHLHALAASGRRFDVATVGLLRGTPQDTPTVRDLQRFGMQLHWLGYGGYRARHLPGFWQPWRERYPQLHPVPEGGGGLPGALGCAPLVGLIRAQLPALGWDDYHGLWLAVGTGTTMAGLVIGEAGTHPVYGAMAVPADHGVAEQVQAILTEAGLSDCDYRLLEACRGGFAAVDAPLLDFLEQSETATQLPLEPVYTAKALIALRQHVEAGYFARGCRLVFLHTGGLQGRDAAILKQDPDSPRAEPRAGYTES